MPNVSSFGAQTDNAVVSGTVTDRQMIIPELPPQGLMSVGPRVTPNFIKEPWSKQRSYDFFDVVKDVTGSSYIAIKPVIPTNTELSDEEFWFKWSDPDARFDELNEIVKTFNERIQANTSDIQTLESKLNAPKPNKYGFAIALLAGFLTEESVKKRIDNAYAAGANNVNICVYMGTSEISTPKSITDYALSYAKKLGLMTSLKVHDFTDSASAYKQAVLDYLSALDNKVNTVIIFNEPSEQYLLDNSQTMISTINGLKSSGYTVGVSFNNEGIVNGRSVIDACDFLGINMYPSQGYSLTYTVESMMRTLSDTFNTLSQGVNKPIWVTETGILPKKCFLFAPELYRESDAYPPNSTIGREVDYNVATSYYRAAIKALANCCDNLILWYGETSLTSENAPLVRSA